MKKIIAHSALIAILASANAMAADSNLTFTGSVTSSTCTMNASHATQTFTIPEVALGTLGIASGPMQNKVGGTVAFTDCPATISKVSVSSITSTGTPLPNNDRYYRIPASGTATGILLHFAKGPKETDGVAVDGANPNWSVATSNGAAAIPVYIGVGSQKVVNAAYPAATAGNFSSDYTMTFSWS